VRDHPLETKQTGIAARDRKGIDGEKGSDQPHQNRKELLEFLERATDKAEDVANVLETGSIEEHLANRNTG